MSSNTARSTAGFTVTVVVGNSVSATLGAVVGSMRVVVVAAVVVGGTDVGEAAAAEEVSTTDGDAASDVHDTVVSITTTTHTRAPEAICDLTCQGSDAARTTRSLINSIESQSLFSERS